METITCFKTSDDTLFESKLEAEKHEEELKFNEWYVDNPIMGNLPGSFVELCDFKDYIKENSEWIKKLL